MQIPENDIEKKHCFLAAAIGLFGIVSHIANEGNAHNVNKMLDDLFDEAVCFNNAGEFQFAQAEQVEGLMLN